MDNIECAYYLLSILDILWDLQDLTRVYGFKIRATFLIIFSEFSFGTEWKHQVKNTQGEDFRYLFKY